MQDSIDLKNYFFYFASFVVILAGIKMANEVVVILFLAIFISSIFSSLLKVLHKKAIPKLFSYFIVLLISIIKRKKFKISLINVLVPILLMINITFLANKWDEEIKKKIIHCYNNKSPVNDTAPLMNKEVE